MRKHRLIFAGILVCLIVSLFTKDFSLFLFGLGAGAVTGFCIEYTGVKIVKLWSYSGEDLPVRTVLRGWGEIGVVAVIATQWIPNLGIAFLVGLLFPLAVFEFSNIRKKNWSYYAPRWLVVIGWGIIILSFQSTARIAALLPGRGF